MRKIYYLTKHFLKVFTAYKINFLSILIIPVFGVIYQQSAFLFQQIPVAEYYYYISIWLAYMVAISSFSTGHQIVMMREQQFLKQMKFIVKDYRLIIYAEILTQFIILIFTVTILVILSTILFKIPFLNLLFFAYGKVIIPFLPLSLVFLIFNLLPIHTENLQPIITVATMLIIFSINFIDLEGPLSTFLIIVNPLNYAIEIGKIWDTLFFSSISINYFAITFATVLYLIIGYFSLNNTRIVANFRI